ncbi:MAG: hypothetical protein QOI92_1242, partial [Chloroflexota bacterium]|nr:hypothetical protein [Chloroflexota bacterium]
MTGLLSLARLGAATLLVLAAIGLWHAAAPPVAATDCVTYYCATLTVSGSGPGSARIYDDQGEIDCYYNGSSSSGTCSVQYYWIGQDSPSLKVTITVLPSPNSYTCNFVQCGQAGASSTSQEVLERDASRSTMYKAYLAKAFTRRVVASGDGSGHVISNPAGIDCTVTAGVPSGTCQHTWYFTFSFSERDTATPAAGSYVCHDTTSACAGVGVVANSSVDTSVTLTTNDVWIFNKGHPILSVGV